MYYDSYWESLGFPPGERDAWREAFPPLGPDEFEIAPRTARRWADAGYSPARARAVFEAAGCGHLEARRWNWTDPDTALAWRAAGFGPEDSRDWSLSFSLDEAPAWRDAGFGAAEAERWAHVVGTGGARGAQAWAGAGFDVEEATTAISEGITLEAALLRRSEPDAPLGRGNGGPRHSR